MEKRVLPAAFTDEMRRLLEEEYELFEQSYDSPRFNGLRLNTLKMSPEEFEERSPFRLTKVPWAPEGYYYDYRDAPGRHPYYRAGLYYLQEPSAMAPAALLPVSPGDRVLDLCAAPGGKATQLGAKLRGEGLLLANEISASRAKALVKNIELFGIPNAFVSNAVPARLEPFFRGYFDKVLVDAPCSGEGMFRKDPDAAKAWYPDKVKECAAIQKDIVLRAADLLREGGMMVYSTCTFSPEENELVVARLLKERPEMELIPLSRDGGREGFAQGFSLKKLAQLGYLTEAEAEEIRDLYDPDGEKLMTMRLWPHRIRGEGHFAALLRKKGGQTEEEAVLPQKLGGKTKEEADRLQKKGGQAGEKAALLQKKGKLENRREQKAEKSLKKGRGGKNKTGRSAGNYAPDAEQKRLLEAFLKDYCDDLPPMERIEVRGGQTYLMPEGFPDTSGISFLRRGLYLGELKKGRFEPAQELAMALDVNFEDPAGRRISFSPEDSRISRYLRGETISAEEEENDEEPGTADLSEKSAAPGDRPVKKESGQNGWRLVAVDGLPLGWAKQVGGQLKNKYLLSWREQ